jgi:hypothetical protein
MKLFITIIAVVFGLANFSTAQDSPSPFELSLMAIRTDAEKAAVAIAAKYVKSLNVEQLLIGEGFLTSFTPQVEIKAGSEGTFSGILASVSGFHAIFQTTEINGVETPDSSKYFSVFSFSGGIETDQYLDNISLLAEVGYSPLLKLDNTYFLGLNPKIGLFAQGGYKLGIGTSETKTGGAEDKSAEDPNSALLRLKLGGDADFRLLDFGDNNEFSIDLNPVAWLWYDVLHSQIYYNFKGTISLNLDGQTSYDINYEFGSGAPNFNQGGEFSTGLTIRF